jgi:ketosteroid isomerase-like protein
MTTSDDEPLAVSNTNIEQEIREVNAEWATALAQRDGSALDRIMSNDFVSAYPFEGDDKEQYIAAVVAGDLKVDSLVDRDVTLRVSGGTAIIFGSETANWHYKGRDLSGTYRFLRVYSKQDGRWQIVALHLCSPTHR